MAAKTENDEPKPKDTVEGYTGKKAGVKYERDPGASKEAVVSDAGTTEPTQVFGGDGKTPFADWDKSQEERRKKEAELDKKNREKAIEAAGIVHTTEKHGHGG